MQWLRLMSYLIHNSSTCVIAYHASVSMHLMSLSVERKGFSIYSVEVQIHNVKKALSNTDAVADNDDDKEVKFWKKILNKELKPVTVHLQQASKEIGQKLKSLRNSTLTIMFIINMMWIILLYTVTLPQLVKYGLPDRAFQLLFLAVYGVIVLVSFVAMLMHRFLMLIHFLGRPEVLKEAVQEPHEEPVLLETSHTY